MIEALIIDDNRTTANALGQMVNVLGFRARLAYGSSAAISMLSSGLIPQFVCLDLNMPGVDGFEILSYLRREPHLTPVPVFVITSDDQPETRRKVIRLGASVIIVKPATIDALEEALRRVRLLT